MIVDVATLLALVIAFVVYDRRAAGGRRMQTWALQPPGASPIDLACRRAGARSDAIARGARAV